MVSNNIHCAPLISVGYCREVDKHPQSVCHFLSHGCLLLAKKQESSVEWKKRSFTWPLCSSLQPLSHTIVSFALPPLCVFMLNLGLKQRRSEPAVTSGPGSSSQIIQSSASRLDSVSIQPYWKAYGVYVCSSAILQEPKAV